MSPADGPILSVRRRLDGLMVAAVFDGDSAQIGKFFGNRSRVFSIEASPIAHTPSPMAPG
jgi:hypothetical protein